MIEFDRTHEVHPILGPRCGNIEPLSEGISRQRSPDFIRGGNHGEKHDVPFLALERAGIAALNSMTAQFFRTYFFDQSFPDSIGLLVTKKRDHSYGSVSPRSEFFTGFRDGSSRLQANPTASSSSRHRQD